MKQLYDLLQKVDLIKLGIAFTVMICLNAIVMALITKEIPEGNREIIIHTLGLIEGVIVSIAAYYWGSSSGSKEKTDAMSRALNKQ